MNTQTNEKFENGWIALLGFRNVILDAGEKGQWPSIIKKVADRLGTQPDASLVHRLTADFGHALMELSPSSLVTDDKDIIGSDKKVDAKAYKRFFPLFEGYWIGRLGAF
ncbi:hypothetical protein [Methylocaldum sp.]|uniref:hypothetical protein n=1 Tax=Methylocaldum sp. TaxID=1969727 RepID=UPI002D35DC33|nr:hypothetical protein [Methylocaldum sp.]HYE35660.1 hypothetical protein [Methylocaldum sp.]